jgi:2-polyprenyl-3-methyl-5-hydroxy-6-metoxy-1,4-benzoquinol methylase
MKTLPEVIVTPRRAGEFACWNPFVRTHLLGDLAFVELLGALRDGATVAGPFRVRDASLPSFADGLLGDPTGLDREATLEGVEPVDLDAALELATRAKLVVDDVDAYREFLSGRKLNAIDRAHRGTIHQAAGEHVLLRLRRPSVDDWWVDQKFTEDRREPRAGPYRDVQWVFARERWTPERLAGRRVLDFGCGPGLFARLFASAGASVLGVDTSSDHLETATRLAGDDGLSESTDFRLLELPPEVTLDALGEKFDVILLSDVLMFYFHSYDESLELDPAGLLKTLAGLLAEGGTIEVLEPNGLFWQQPQLGDPDRPLTVLTEYRHRRFGVTPTLEEMSRAAESAGLCIAAVRELAGDTGFAAEFPPWWFFELRRSPLLGSAP